MRRQSIPSPEGTVEVQSHKYLTSYNRRVIQPSLRDARNVELAPALNRRAILTMSLRDRSSEAGSRRTEDGGRRTEAGSRSSKQLPNQKSEPKRRRKSAVPEGQPTIAHRFNGGIRRQSITSPEGTVEVQFRKYFASHDKRVIQPSLRDAGNVELAPALKRRAILTMSLRDLPDPRRKTPDPRPQTPEGSSRGLQHCRLRVQRGLPASAGCRARDFSSLCSTQANSITATPVNARIDQPAVSCQDWTAASPLALAV